MTAQIIILAENRRERAATAAPEDAWEWPWAIAADIIDPFGLMRLYGLGIAAQYNTEPAVIYLFEEDGA